MAHRIAIGSGLGERCLHDLLYKADRPRRIDSYIDFFGDGTARRPAAARWADRALRLPA